MGLNGGDLRGHAEAFVAEFGWEFPVLLDPDRTLTRQLFGRAAHPAVAVLDGQGRVASRHLGPSGPAVWDELAATAGRT